MQASFFFYDYETTGIDPKRDRIIQFAGIRTDENFNLIADPIAAYGKLSPEIVPNPEALVITGISHGLLESEGINEINLTRLIHKEFAKPYTCVAGYNNIRFDDEFTRYSFYRNFYDPYGREWQNNNSRWDLIDVVRMCAALRPDGIKWPRNTDNYISFKLEELTRANDLQHNKAHDALSDVYATIEMAKLVNNKQPKLFNYLLNCRKKSFVNNLININFDSEIDISARLLVHSSRQIKSEFCATSVFLPLLRDPLNQNSILAWDLRYEPEVLFSLQDMEQAKYLLYTAQDKLQPGETRLALKNIFINKSPAIAPFKTIDNDSFERIKLDKNEIIDRAKKIVKNKNKNKNKDGWFNILIDLSKNNTEFNNLDVEHQLYDKFISNNDRSICNKIHIIPKHQLSELGRHFTDERLKELLFRYRARNFPETLTEQEQKSWDNYCLNRLNNINNIASLSKTEFIIKTKELLSDPNMIKNKDLLQSWLDFYQGIL